MYRRRGLQLPYHNNNNNTVENVPVNLLVLIVNSPWSMYGMAGLRINDQKNVIAVTMTIATAFKICIIHRKNGFLNRS